MFITPDQYQKGTIAAIKNLARPKGNQGVSKSKRQTYKDVIVTFDIETTRLDNIEQSIMYVWQMHVHHYCTIVGRTWKELTDLLNQFRQELGNSTLCVYVHNLSYEFQFLRAIYECETDEVFAVDSRKVLKCTMWDKQIEFRCSYLHSNMSLAEYTRKMGVDHGKLSGDEFDYTKKRYPWTPLTDQEIEYCLNDVIGLAEALEKEMQADGDNLYTIPLTSTGYVRRDAKRAMRQCRHTVVKDILPDTELYTLLREAFRGGNTHANRFYAERILHDIKSADRSSSYPAVMCNCKYPISKFVKIGEATTERVVNLINKKGKAILARIKLWNVRLQDELWGAPYLTVDKSRKIINAAYDNGRILSADYLETTITDVDLRIILSEYDFDNLEFFDVYYARYGYLPKPLVNTVIDYYKRKTELKGVEGQEVYYMKSKNKLNSCYGMMAQDPVKQDTIFNGGDWSKGTTEVAELLKAYNDKAFLAYQWGVWVTAHARMELEEGIRLAGHNFVYCDTDSVKYRGDVDFNDYNKKKIAESKNSGAFATDPKGTSHYMGVYEDDGYYYSFATMGAKKYAYQYEKDGPTFCTIAGVNKKKGGKELDANGGLSAFQRGFIFRDAGGTESVYNDHPTNGYIDIDGHKLLITPNIVIRDSEYTLGVSRDYSATLLGLDKKLLDKLEFI